MTEPKDRLTFDGNFCDIAQCREERWGKYCPDGACSQRKVWERLKQYEDSDAVSVVRCRECKHLNVVNRKELYAHCQKTNTVFLPFELDTREHFCSLGERNEGAD